MKTEITILVVVALAVAPGGARAPGRAPARRIAHSGAALAPAEVYAALRNRALHVKPQQIGLRVSPGATQPYGILMETGYPLGVATLAAFATGDASLYFSTGGGVIGGVGHATVREAARRFVTAAEPFLAIMAKTTVFPPPKLGRTRFYVLTPRSLYTAEASERDLGEHLTGLSPLFYRGQEVITQIRLVTESRSWPVRAKTPKAHPLAR